MFVVLFFVTQTSSDHTDVGSSLRLPSSPTPVSPHPPTLGPVRPDTVSRGDGGHVGGKTQRYFESLSTGNRGKQTVITYTETVVRPTDRQENMLSVTIHLPVLINNRGLLQ